MSDRLDIIVLGLSITSSWGNGHATTYRGLIRELTALGHRVTFLERDTPWYAPHRDLPKPQFCDTRLYSSVEELQDRYGRHIQNADVVIVGSYVPDGVRVGRWVVDTARGVTAFYDIDTPVTLAKLQRKDYEYLAPDLIKRFGLYLSFTGGPTLHTLESQYGSPRALPLYCSYDPELYYPEQLEKKWDLGYMGTYSDDRQPTLTDLLIEPARSLTDRRFVVAGPQYPRSIEWPENVQRVDHLAPAEHRTFYSSQRYTLNVTRQDMIRAGFSPSVRLFEAAACGTPIISDYWEGLDSLFEIGREIFVARSAEESIRIITETPESDRRQVGLRAMERIRSEHTAAHRAAQLESYLLASIAAGKTCLL